MQRAIGHLEIDRRRCRGTPVRPHLTIGLVAHINLTGDYLWEQAAIACPQGRGLFVLHKPTFRLLGGGIGVHPLDHNVCCVALICPS
jgi:hypothetical protein